MDNFTFSSKVNSEEYNQNKTLFREMAISIFWRWRVPEEPSGWRPDQQWTSKYRRTLFLQAPFCSTHKEICTASIQTSTWRRHTLYVVNSLPGGRLFQAPHCQQWLLLIRNAISVIIVCIVASAKSCRSHIKGSYRSVPSRQSEGDGSGGRLMWRERGSYDRRQLMSIISDRWLVDATAAQQATRLYGRSICLSLYGRSQ